MVRLHMLNLRLGVWRNRRSADLVTPDREQIRQDAEEVIGDGYYLPGEPGGGNPYIASHIALAHACLALLDTLEQAEQEVNALEQTLRETQAALDASHHDANQIAQAAAEVELKILKARAEQAERERDDLARRATAGDAAHEQLHLAEARLAAVPALVEAASEMLEWAERQDPEWDNPRQAEQRRQAHERLYDALAAYQETTK